MAVRIINRYTGISWVFTLLFGSIWTSAEQYRMNGTINNSSNATNHSIFTENSEKERRRMIQDGAMIIISTCSMLYCLLVMACCARSKLSGGSTHNRLNLSIRVLIIYTFLHGLIATTGYTFQRNVRHEIWYSASFCTFSTLMIDFFDNFYFALLFLIATEQLIAVTNLSVSGQSLQKTVGATLSGLVLVTMAFSWIPLIPGVLPETVQTTYYSADNNTKDRVTRFILSYSCTGQLNKQNPLSHHLFLGYQIFYIIITTVIYCRVLYIVRRRLNRYVNISDGTKNELRRVFKQVILISLITFISNIPYGLVEIIRKHCGDIFDATLEDRSSCSKRMLEVRINTRLIFHFGNSLAPIIYTMMDAKIRQDLANFLRCCNSTKLSEGSTEASFNTNAESAMVTVRFTDLDRNHATL